MDRCHAVAVVAMLALLGAACGPGQDAAGGSADEVSDADTAPADADDVADAPADDVDGDGGSTAEVDAADGADADDGVSPSPLEKAAPGSGADGEPGSGTGPQVPSLLPAIDDLDETVVTITTSTGERVRVDAKVAATTEDRRHGLMQVPEIPAGIGMLFVFDKERSGGFWMFNTLVPLDIAYIDDAGEIGTILAMEPCGSDDPGDCPTYAPDRPYSAALEVPQGWYADVGVATGDRVAWTEPVTAG